MKASCCKRVKGKLTVCSDECSQEQCARVREWYESGYEDTLIEMVSCVGIDRVIESIASHVIDPVVRNILETAVLNVRKEASR